MYKRLITIGIVAASVSFAGVSLADQQQQAGQQQPTLNLQPAGSMAIASKNLTEGEAFLAKNKTKKGVVTLPSGVQYQVLKEGTGPKPTATSVVTVDYEGKLLNGNVFDSSYKRGQPATFPLSNVIPGWQQALQKMPVGSTWRIFIPPQLAYGSRGAGNSIDPNETLVFKVHLIKIDS